MEKGEGGRVEGGDDVFDVFYLTRQLSISLFFSWENCATDTTTTGRIEENKKSVPDCFLPCFELFSSHFLRLLIVYCFLGCGCDGGNCA